MTIAKQIKDSEVLIQNLTNEFNEEYEISSEIPKKLSHLTKTYNIPELLKSIDSNASKFNYPRFVDFTERISSFTQAVTTLKDEIDLEKFYKDGHIVDWKALRKEYEAKRLHKTYPIDWVKFKDWINNPRLELKNINNETVHYDKYVIKKTNFAILQMIFNEMDIYELNIGAEGSGKSCFSSQRVLYYYTFLKDVGLIDYHLNIKEMYFTEVAKMLENHELESTTKFKIECLDESNKLNRQNYRDDDSIDFKNEMRTERKNQRIMLLNMQQVGELDTSITLSRVNFIFMCDMDSSVKTGTLQKGKAKMVIIPRGTKIYSEFQKKDLYRSEIKETLSKFLESKSQYYKDLPESLIVKKFNFENVWGFDKKEYERHTSASNRSARISTKEIKITDYVAYIMLNKMPALKYWELDRTDKKEKKMYNTIAKFISGLKYRLASKPHLKQQFDMLYGDEE